MEPAREIEPWHLIRERARKKTNKYIENDLLPVFTLLLASPIGQPPPHLVGGQQERPGDTVYFIPL